MSRDDLAHLSEGAVASGVDLTRAEAAALNATKLVTVTPEAHGWRVAAGQWVGAVRCGNLDIRVAPKVGPAKVLELLARANGVRNLTVDPERLGLADDADLSAILAVLFEREAQTALARRPPRGYRTEDQSLPVVRGRIRLVDQHLRRFGTLTPIEVTVDEWTLDTDDNRRLRLATQILLGLPGIPAHARTGLRRVDRILHGVVVPARGTRPPPWTPTRLNTDLHRLLHLADLVLTGASVEHRAGDVVAHGFTLNMAWVFEALVARILAEQAKGTGLRWVAQRHDPLDEDGRLTIRPDLLLLSGRDVVAVADTKYKLYDDGVPPNDNVYQLVTYSLRYGLSTGHLLYCGDTRPSHEGHFSIRNAGVEVLTHWVDLTAPVTNIEAGLADFCRVTTIQRALSNAPQHP